MTCPAGTSELVTSELDTRRCRSSNNLVATLNCLPTTFGTSTVELLQKLPKLKNAHKKASKKANTAPPITYFCGKLPNFANIPSCGSSSSSITSDSIGGNTCVAKSCCIGRAEVLPR